MNTSKLMSGIAVFALVASAALAEPNHPAPVTAQLSSTAPVKHQPKPLNEGQMEKVTAGASLGDSVSDVPDMSVDIAMRKSGGGGTMAGKPYLVFTFGTVFTTK